MQASFQKYTLIFRQASGTSRGVLKTKETYFLVIENGDRSGVGECGLFRGLSYDDRPDYEDKLQWLCNNIQLDSNYLLSELVEFPSIQFGLEQAFLSIRSNNFINLYILKFNAINRVKLRNMGKCRHL